ncbi:hypothetical protein [Streptomyces umbrinus]|nr:hypothetical protein [Streptomyces phaeochromogenes]
MPGGLRRHDVLTYGSAGTTRRRAEEPTRLTASTGSGPVEKPT